MTNRVLGFVISVSWLILHLQMMFYHYYCKRNNMPSPFASIYPALKTMAVPAMGACWHFLSPAHQFTTYAYIVCAALGDLFLMNYDFRIYAIGGFFFFLAHVFLTLRFGVEWRKVPWYAYVLMLPNLLVVGVYLVPELFRATVQAACFAGYSFFLEVGACSAVARVHKYTFKSMSYWLAVIGYFLFLGSDALLLKGEVVHVEVYPQMEIMGTYLAGQIMIMLALAIDPLQTKQKSI